MGYRPASPEAELQSSHLRCINECSPACNASRYVVQFFLYSLGVLKADFIGRLILTKPMRHEIRLWWFWLSLLQIYVEAGHQSIGQLAIFAYSVFTNSTHRLLLPTSTSIATSVERRRRAFHDYLSSSHYDGWHPFWLGFSLIHHRLWPSRRWQWSLYKWYSRHAMLACIMTTTHGWNLRKCILQH